jgi:hypothetical protein
MNLEDVLKSPEVAELRRLALDLKAHPERLNVPASQGLTFAESWHSVWKSPPGQGIQKKIRDKFGAVTIIPYNDGSLGVAATGHVGQGQPWGGVSEPDQGELNIKRDVYSTARAKACEQAVRTVQASYPSLTFQECWQIAAAESPSLFASKETVGGFDADDYQLKTVYGVRG